MKTRALKTEWPMLRLAVLMSIDNGAGGDNGGGGGDGGQGGAGGGQGGAGGDNGGQGGSGGDGGQGGTPPPWYGADFDKEGAVYLEKNGFKSWGDVVNSARNLEKLVGADKNTVLRIPADRSDPKAMEPVFKALGLPDSVDGYGIKEDPTRGIEGDNLKSFASMAHAAQLLPNQVQAILKWYGDGVVSEQESIVQTRDNLVTELKKEWGADGDARLAAANALIREYGGDELGQYLETSDLGNNKALIKMIDAIAAKLADTSELPGGAAGDSGGKMSPAMAEANLRDFERDNAAALRDRSHPDHKALVSKREQLIKATIPA